jgi:hypothetical protein
MTQADETTGVAEAVQRTAEALGLPAEEVDWITSELLQTETREAGPEIGLPEEGERDERVVIPNRISYISHVVQGFDGTRTNYTFYANCTYDIRWILWSDSINRFERDGWCRTPNGSWAARWKMWWRASV